MLTKSNTLVTMLKVTLTCPWDLTRVTSLPSPRATTRGSTNSGLLPNIQPTMACSPLVDSGTNMATLNNWHKICEFAIKSSLYNFIGTSVQQSISLTWQCECRVTVEHVQHHILWPHHCPAHQDHTLPAPTVASRVGWWTSSWCWVGSSTQSWSWSQDFSCSPGILLPPDLSKIIKVIKKMVY